MDSQKDHSAGLRLYAIHRGILLYSLTSLGRINTLPPFRRNIDPARAAKRPLLSPRTSHQADAAATQAGDGFPSRLRGTEVARPAGDEFQEHGASPRGNSSWPTEDGSNWS